MKKCCFIIPYYGKLPNYINVFFKTCEKNPDYEFLIFTNDINSYKYPKNVKIIYETMDNFIKNAEEKLGFKICICDAHKICDFKPAFGFLYEEYIEDYYMWGHCDLDIIIGNLDKFITDDIINNYDKIFCLGHMVIYKNEKENNRVFMKKYNGRELYKEVFKNKKTMVFDETFDGKENVNTLFEMYNKKIFTNDFSFNVKIFPTNFTRTKFVYEKYIFEDEATKNAIYIWDDGDLYRLVKENNILIREDYLYLHLQQRKMYINNKIFENNFFQIIPNCFETIKTTNITINNFNNYKKRRLTLYYFTKHFEWKLSKWRKRYDL